MKNPKEEAKQRAKNYMSLKGALEPKQIKCYCGHTTYCDCSPIETTPNKTNMTQQTAVEWLIEQISSSKYFYNLMEEIESRSTIVQPNAILQQAKEMEKEQIKDAHNQGYADGYRDNGNSPIDYYNETFKQQ